MNLQDVFDMDTPDSNYGIWCPLGWLADWDRRMGEPTYTQQSDDAALWRYASDAYHVAKLVNGVVYDLDAQKLLTIVECLS